jgi:hypothetical protein
MGRILQLWRVRPVLTSAFLLACAVTAFFAGATIYRAVYWSMHREQPVSPWMTVGYVGRSWGLDPRELDALAGLPLPQKQGHPLTLAEIAQDRGVPVETVIAEVEAAIAAMRAEGATSADKAGSDE